MVSANSIINSMLCAIKNFWRLVISFRAMAHRKWKTSKRMLSRGKAYGCKPKWDTSSTSTQLMCSKCSFFHLLSRFLLFVYLHNDLSHKYFCLLCSMICHWWLSFFTLAPLLQLHNKKAKCRLLNKEHRHVMHNISPSCNSKKA